MWQHVVSGSWRVKYCYWLQWYDVFAIMYSQFSTPDITSKKRVRVEMNSHAVLCSNALISSSSIASLLFELTISVTAWKEKSCFSMTLCRQMDTLYWQNTFTSKQQLITDTQIKTLVQAGEHRQTDWQNDNQTNGCYQTYYLPCFAVDNQNQKNFEK